MTALNPLLRLSLANRRKKGPKKTSHAFSLGLVPQANLVARASAMGGGALSTAPAASVAGRPSVSRPVTLSSAPSSGVQGEAGIATAIDLNLSPGTPGWGTTTATAFSLRTVPGFAVTGAPAAAGQVNVSAAHGAGLAGHPNGAASPVIALAPEAAAVGNGPPPVSSATFSDGTVWSDGTGWIDG
jgi:hypothetical protein